VDSRGGGELYRLLSAVCWLLSAVCCMVYDVCCLLSAAGRRGGGDPSAAAFSFLYKIILVSNRQYLDDSPLNTHYRDLECRGYDIVGFKIKQWIRRHFTSTLFLAQHQSNLKLRELSENFRCPVPVPFLLTHCLKL
jgi:hypothetical protein